MFARCPALHCHVFRDCVCSLPFLFFHVLYVYLSGRWSSSVAGSGHLQSSPHWIIYKGSLHGEISVPMCKLLIDCRCKDITYSTRIWIGWYWQHLFKRYVEGQASPSREETSVIRRTCTRTRYAHTAEVESQRGIKQDEF